MSIFERGGKRLTAITEPGRAILEMARRMLRDAENIRRVGEEHAGGDSGSLVIATTHTQARCAPLPGASQPASSFIIRGGRNCNDR